MNESKVMEQIRQTVVTLRFNIFDQYGSEEMSYEFMVGSKQLK